MSNTRVGMVVRVFGGIHCWSEGMALTALRHPGEAVQGKRKDACYAKAEDEGARRSA